MDKDSIWIDKTMDKAAFNHIRCVTDENLSQLRDKDIELFLYIVMHETYDEAADILGVKVTTVRNKASQIYKTCGFKNRTEAFTYAVILGIKGLA